MATYPRIASLKTYDDFQSRIRELNLQIPSEEVVESAPESPLSKPGQVGKLTIGNRFCILPMEGWDGTKEGKPGVD